MSIPGDRRPLWWDPGVHIAHLSEGAARVARYLEQRLLETPDPALENPLQLDAFDLGALWAATTALREAIEDARSAGASPDWAGGLHRRLDAEVRTLVTDSISLLRIEHRRLLEGVSHDIRSPLNSILFLADALLNQHGGALSPSQRRQIGVIYGAAVALVRLVNDLIDFTRLAEGVGIGLTEVDFTIDSVLDDVKRLIAPLVEHHQVRLRVRHDMRAPRTGDPQLLSRLLINLLSNAIDAASEGGSVDAAFSDEGEAGLRLEVANDGEIPDLDELRESIDGPADRTLRGRGWTHGLGLTISAALVRTARGSMVVETPGGGRTRFTVILPFPAADRSE
jgi:signal transduction histidine kinase